MSDTKSNANTNVSTELDAARAEIKAMLEAAKAEAARLVEDARTADTGNAERAAIKREHDRLNEYVEIELFRDDNKYKDDVVVSVNGENCRIMRGEPVRIKRKFAEVLINSAKQDASAAKLIARLSGQAQVFQ